METGSRPRRKNTQIGNGGVDSSASTHFSRLDPQFPELQRVSGGLAGPPGDFYASGGRTG